MHDYALSLTILKILTMSLIKVSLINHTACMQIEKVSIESEDDSYSKYKSYENVEHHVFYQQCLVANLHTRK